MQTEFDNLAGMPVLKHYEEAFRKATGVSLRLVSPEESKQRFSYGPDENIFCALVASTPAGCDACQQAQARVRRSAAKKLSTQQVHCFAGLSIIAVPVMIGGKHVATLMSGQIFRREPTQRDFEMIVQMLGGGAGADWVKKARKAYFETPVIPTDRFQAIIQLLTVFTQHLVDEASRHLFASSEQDPGAVASAKKFIQSHADEPITLEQVVRHVHVSRFYFCKLFKKTTGMTLTEYISRIRVEKAKSLLVDPSLRISEVVFASGFGSIPQFNNIFKRFAGMPPTEYRAALRAQSHH